jgi:hypothetical protein
MNRQRASARPEPGAVDRGHQLSAIPEHANGLRPALAPWVAAPTAEAARDPAQQPMPSAATIGRASPITGGESPLLRDAVFIHRTAAAHGESHPPGPWPPVPQPEPARYRCGDRRGPPYLPHSTPALPARPAQHPPPGQAEQALRNRGISEPALLARAADLDGAAKVLISSAASITQRRARATHMVEPAPKSSPAGHQHPARVAAKDTSPATTSNPSPPRLVPISHQITHNTATQRRPSR